MKDNESYDHMHPNDYHHIKFRNKKTNYMDKTVLLSPYDIENIYKFRVAQRKKFDEYLAETVETLTYSNVKHPAFKTSKTEEELDEEMRFIFSILRSGEMDISHMTILDWADVLSQYKDSVLRSVKIQTNKKER